MPPIAALHKYFIAANKMRIRFEASLGDRDVWQRVLAADPHTRVLLLLADDFGVFMFYWYSGLYVVIEGYRELNLQDSKIDGLLQSPNVDGLRLARNATFHFQREFLSPKATHFIASKDSVPWVHELTEAFSEFFLRNVPKV